MCYKASTSCYYVLWGSSRMQLLLGLVLLTVRAVTRMHKKTRSKTYSTCSILGQNETRKRYFKRGYTTIDVGNIFKSLFRIYRNNTITNAISYFSAHIFLEKHLSNRKSQLIELSLNLIVYLELKTYRKKK